MLQKLIRLLNPQWKMDETEAPQAPISPSPIPQSTDGRLEAAKAYLGLSERLHKTKLKKLLKMDPMENSWCAAFITAIEKECGAKGTDNLAARSYLKYGKKVTKPQPGDIVVFWREDPHSWKGHVSYYVKEDDKRVYVLGGNQEDSVSYKWYDKNRVLGYRRP